MRQETGEGQGSSCRFIKEFVNGAVVQVAGKEEQEEEKTGEDSICQRRVATTAVSPRPRRSGWARSRPQTGRRPAAADTPTRRGL